jgi:hypothetical protein
LVRIQTVLIHTSPEAPPAGDCVDAIRPAVATCRAVVGQLATSVTANWPAHPGDAAAVITDPRRYGVDPVEMP